ncbi:MAG: DUF4340 domain-containing protein [Pirellulaceae bacterium]
MNETSKTVAFVVSAALLAVAAGSAHYMTQPRQVAGFEKVGDEFFPDFLDAMDAKSLAVTVFDEETEEERQFSVAFSDGLWRIPSHHDYPAEAAERLARTATSIMGLQRQACVARREGQHAEYGVVDPSDDTAEVDTAGQRITLRDEQGEVLADYIIGKPAGNVDDDENEWGRIIDRNADYYFIRRPDEKETFVAAVQIDLSARFQDWIEPDLLKVDPDEINRLEIDDYELIPQGRAVAKSVKERLQLTRDDFAGWQLEDLRPEAEEVNNQQVAQIIDLLDSMTIAGVRPKLTLDGEPLVNSDLSMNTELQQRFPQRFGNMLGLLQQELEFYGFTLGATEENPDAISLLGLRGEMRAATNSGVLYTLYFGRTVTGDAKDIEIGAAVSTSDPDSAESGNGNEEEQASDEPELEAPSGGEENEEAPSSSKSRYVAIRVDFDDAALGDQPVKPEEPPAAPEKPEGYDEWKVQQQAKEMAAGEEPPAEEAADPEASDEDGSDDANSDNAGSDPDNEADPDDGEPSEQDPEQDPADESSGDDAPSPPVDIAAANDERYLEYEAALQTHQLAEMQYTTDVETWDAAVNVYDQRKQYGEEMVKELNERFAEWYYVVPAESLSTLKMSRGDLVTIRETPPPPMEPPGMEPRGMAPEPELPDAPSIDFPQSPTDIPSDDESGDGESGNDDKPDDG